MSDDQKRASVAERMTQAIGLPASSVNNLISELTDEEIDQLSGISDDEFKQESVKLVNKAQQRQFASIGKALAEDTAVVTVSGSKPAAEPDAGAKKKLVIPIAGSTDSGNAGDSGITAPTAPGTSGLVVPGGEPPPKPKISVAAADGPTESQTMVPPPGGPAAKPKKLQINMKAAAENQAASEAAARVIADAVAAAPPPAPMPTPGAPAAQEQPANDAPAPTPQASGIKAVEPEGRKPLNISPQEAELLEDEVQTQVRRADLPEEGQTLEVSSVFKGLEDENAQRSKKMVPILIGGGVGALAILGLILYLVISMFIGPSDPVIVQPDPPPKNPNPTPVVPDTPKKEIGKWAWKNTASFEESFENPYVLREKESAFTVEMWISIVGASGVDSVTLTTVNDLFTIGMKKYRNKPVIFFDLPEAYSGKGGVKNFMPNSRGWIHIAGVYDPIDSSSLTLFINGHKAGTRTCKKDAPRLLASIFIIRGNITGEESYVLIDDIRMSEGAVYTDDFKPVRNMETEKNTTAFLRMEEKKVGATFEIKDLAQEKVKPYLFTVGEWVEVDTENFKMAVDRTAELEKEMFSWMKRKWPADKYEKFRADWNKLPAEKKQQIRETFEAKLESEKNKPKPAPEGS